MPSLKLKLKDRIAKIDKEFRMNVWNFDGNDLTFSLSEGKENLGYGTMYLSDIFGDKTLRKSIKLFQNPSALTSLATSSISRVEIGELEFVISKTGAQKTQAEKKAVQENFKSWAGKVKLKIFAAHGLKVRQGRIQKYSTK